ncbi:MAG TPA: dihydropteroate synthase [Gammaproteobacteria bacterium]|nr:dihydropteroate synthase [Gammaproteobacteria bacterium]
MVILGLGSNIGDRISNLRKAHELLKQVPKLLIKSCSPLYLSDALLPDQAPSSWDQPYINMAIKCETSLSPLDLLHQLKNIEYAIGRKPLKRHWGPRTIDIDILAWDGMVYDDDVLQVPHVKLPERPFALWPLADLEPYWIYPGPGEFQGKTAAEICARWGSRFSGEAPLHTKQILHRIDTPQLVGILNVTPDSFSDGGDFSQIQTAVHQAYHLAGSGAEIIDIGAEATNPNAIPLDPDDEWERLEPVLRAIKHELPLMAIPPKISVDTRHVEVAAKALRLGVNWINDTSGLHDPQMRELIASANCECVVMHSLGIPADSNRIFSYKTNPIDEIYRWAEQILLDLEQYGIKQERIILDIGLGFGKDAEQSFLLLKYIAEFKKLNIRLMIGHSRKSFLQKFTHYPPEQRDIETTIISNYLADQEVNFLRVHNVEVCSRSFRIYQQLK